MLKAFEVPFINRVSLELDYFLKIDSFSMAIRFWFDLIMKESQESINASIIKTKRKEK